MQITWSSLSAIVFVRLNFCSLNPSKEVMYMIMNQDKHDFDNDWIEEDDDCTDEFCVGRHVANN